MTNFTITIISDTVCPWCYIGYRRLQKAISHHQSRHPSDTFTISWSPFQLNPDASRGKSVDKRSSYEQKLGVDGANLVFERLRSAAEGTGIHFSFEGRTGSTIDSHRVIEFSGEKEMSLRDGSGGKAGGNLSTRLVEELFVDYFERERDITSRDALIQAASRAGLDPDEVRRVLSGNELVEQVVEKAKAARADGVNGVPYFNINDVFSVEGAQEPAAFEMLFERLKKREGSGSKSLL